MATASPLARTDTALAYAGSFTANRGDRFKAWLATDTDRRRNEMAALMVLNADADMLVRIVRAAANGLTMFDGGCTILDCVDEIEREMLEESATKDADLPRHAHGWPL